MTGPVFEIDRVFKASVARVWAAWTDPAALAQWFGPAGTTTTVIHADIRAGGRTLLHMLSPDAPEMWARAVYEAVESPAHIRYRHAFADAAGNAVPSPFGGDWPLELRTTVTLSEAAGGTHLCLTWEPVEATPAEIAAFTAMFDSMRGGWGGSFDRLDAALST